MGADKDVIRADAKAAGRRATKAESDARAGENSTKPLKGAGTAGRSAKGNLGRRGQQ